MGKAAFRNPRVVTITDPIFGPRKEVQADLFEEYQDDERYLFGLGRFVCVVSLGKPVSPPDDEPAG